MAPFQLFCAKRRISLEKSSCSLESYGFKLSSVVGHFPIFQKNVAVWNVVASSNLSSLVGHFSKFPKGTCVIGAVSGPEVLEWFGFQLFCLSMISRKLVFLTNLYVGGCRMGSCSFLRAITQLCEFLFFLQQDMSNTNLSCRRLYWSCPDSGMNLLEIA